ncbi:ABC transporter ATP-binding protein/permease [Acidimicrobiia bacterium]|nr:ABC transporter ATP-binding protein/permease [Acidimicrobiia bacterium]
MITKIKVLIEKTLYISKLTNVPNKKLRIFLSVVFANIAVILDLVIIIIFSVILTEEINFTNPFIVDLINIFLKNKYLLIFLVMIRFGSLLIERLNLELLTLKVGENLRLNLMRESFEKGNLSTSDAYYYINQVSTHVSGFYRSFTLFIINFLQILGFSVFLLITDRELFSFFAFGSILLIFPTKYLISKGKHFQHVSFEDNRRVHSNIERIIENTFLIKILKTSSIEFNNFRDKLKNFTKSQSLNLVYGSLNSILPTFSTIIILSILTTLTDMVKNLTFEFIGVLLRLFQSLSVFTNSLNLVLNSSVHVDELYKLDKFSPKQYNANYSCDLNNEFAVEFTNVSFRYFNSKEFIFQKINFKLNKNSHTLITGPNGAGKSTLLGLITGLYLPEDGLVTISSMKVGYIGVTPLVFKASLKDNLLYGNELVVEDDQILKIIKEFNLYPDLETVDINKEVSNKTLSSGQMQKISFMRALLNNSEILLLDEATSNLDSSSKKLVFSILKNKNITIINSTHNKEDFNFDSELIIDVKNDMRTLRLT